MIFHLKHSSGLLRNKALNREPSFRTSRSGPHRATSQESPGLGEWSREPATSLSTVSWARLTGRMSESCLHPPLHVDPGICITNSPLLPDLPARDQGLSPPPATTRTAHLQKARLDMAQGTESRKLVKCRAHWQHLEGGGWGGGQKLGIFP